MPIRCGRCDRDTVGRLAGWHELFVWDDDGSRPSEHFAYHPYRHRGWWQRLTQPSGRFVGIPVLELCTACGQVTITLRDAAEAPWEEVEHARVIQGGSLTCAECGGTHLVILERIFAGTILYIARIQSRTLGVSMSEPVGLVGATLCPACGLADLYLRELEDLPWDRLDGFAWVTGQRCARCKSSHVGLLRRAGDAVATFGIVDCPPVLGARVTEGVGHLGAFLCADCGFIDVQVEQPASVPWDRIHGFVPPGSDGREVQRGRGPAAQKRPVTPRTAPWRAGEK